MSSHWSESRRARLSKFLTTEITAAALPDHDECWALLSTGSLELADLGVTATGEECQFLVTDPRVPIGRVDIRVGAPGGLVAFDNRGWQGALNATIRLAGADSTVLFNLTARGTIGLPNVYLRSREQLLFWGVGTTAVEAKIEVEGPGAAVIVGDDSLISSGVWIRNFDMHSIFDLETGQQLNAPTDIVLEKHVWLGQDALILGCPRVGAGAIVGARALVKAAVPRKAAVGGVPSRVLRRNVSWGRMEYRMTVAELSALRDIEPGL